MFCGLEADKPLDLYQAGFGFKYKSKALFSFIILRLFLHAQPFLSSKKK